jgi:hypothetical protein
MNLSTPKNQCAEVLEQLLLQPAITHDEIYTATKIKGITARLSDLRLTYRVPIVREWKTVTNKRKRKVKIGVFSIPKESKEKAVEIYKTINRGE